MAGAINYIWQSTFCLFFFYGIYWCFIKNEKAFTLARIYILITPLLALLFPIIEIPVDFNKPSISLENTNFYQVLASQQAPEEIAGSFGLPEVTVSSSRLPVLWEITDYLFIAYLIITLLLAARLIAQFYQLQALFRKGWYESSYHITDKYLKIPTFGLAPIFSYFNRLFWDDTEKLNESEKAQIINHEIEHIRQGHTYDVIYYQILSLLFWFNPAIHLMRTALIDTHEYLADEKVLAKVPNKENYKKLIIRIAFKGLDLPIGNYFIRSTTLKRILMMKKSPKINWYKMVMVLPLTAMLLGLVSMKTYQPSFLTESINRSGLSELENKLINAKDTLEVGIKVVKIKQPKHYELISPLKDGTLTAQIGELQYTFTNIQDDQEYIKVLGMIDNLSIQSITTKKYGKMYEKNVDQEARPKGGKETWNQFLKNAISMPEKERMLNLQRELEIEFVVDESGNITNPVVKRSFGGGLDEKVIAILSGPDAPKWEPAKKDGKPVPTVHTIRHLLTSQGDHTASHDFFPKAPRPKTESPRTVRPVIGESEVYDVVENPPMPAGGMEAWNKYLSKNITYPQRARENNIEGTVYVVFTVSKDGKLENPDVLRGIGGGADEEALRLIENAEDWIPGKQRGEEVAVRMRLPIKFRMAGSDKKEEKIIDSRPGHTTPEIVVTGYGPEPSKKQININIKSKDEVQFNGQTFDLIKFEAYLENYLNQLEKFTKVTANISANDNVNMGSLKDVEKVLSRKGIRSVNYTDLQSDKVNLKLDEKREKQPLFIVDGRVTEYEKLKELDPNNFEKFEVLKDPARTTSLYGSAAKHGAVLITTKEEKK
ncbi:TonB family protein [Litoribacter alkaliphilus]|uniref:TonB family protein n=1 Tax=Litoribacter ruber TaxID=702568 RepID=A0AAP2CI75_9BACT|nr:TonB family protein [Litoribacter alkaliphilus]MBS9525166.1 TonB family protein [Litoribacter alkaliphilus]